MHHRTAHSGEKDPGIVGTGRTSHFFGTPKVGLSYLEAILRQRITLLGPLIRSISSRLQLMVVYLFDITMHTVFYALFEYPVWKDSSQMLAVFCAGHLGWVGFLTQLIGANSSLIVLTTKSAGPLFRFHVNCVLSGG